MMRSFFQLMRAYRKVGIDPSNPNPDGSDYHLMNAIDKMPRCPKCGAVVFGEPGELVCVECGAHQKVQR